MKTDAMLEAQPLYQNFMKTEREKEQETAKEEGIKTIQSVTPQAGGQSKPASDYYRDELLKLVVSRDNVGEFMWYLYTGILVISIVQYYILSRGCVSDASTMEKNYQKFLENEDAAQAQQDAGQNTTYTITS
jgi:hypothetical protein